MTRKWSTVAVTQKRRRCSVARAALAGLRGSERSAYCGRSDELERPAEIGEGLRALRELVVRRARLDDRLAVVRALARVAPRRSVGVNLVMQCDANGLVVFSLGEDRKQGTADDVRSL
jgi:hypothetical protein